MRSSLGNVTSVAALIEASASIPMNKPRSGQLLIALFLDLASLEVGS
jgi:hypothetical protein